MTAAVVAMARLKASVPVPLWEEFLVGLSALVDFEIIRFVRKPPDQTSTEAALAWMQGRGSLCYELSLLADKCTEIARMLEEEAAQRAATTNQRTQP